jgi:carboxymethylenebutenolidase
MAPGEDHGAAAAPAAHEEFTTLRADDGAALRQFFAAPAHGLAHGAVLIVHDIWGFTDFYQQLARRIAAQGFAATLVDFFGRQGELPENMRAPEKTLPPDAMARARARQAQLSDDRFLADAQRAIDDLRARGAPRVASWGFCMGGRLAYVSAARLRGLDGVVAYYGFLRAEPPRQSPLDLVADLRAPVLGIFAGADAGIPPDQVADFENRLRKGTKAHEIVTYAGAPHGFLRYTPPDQSGAIADALARTFRFLDRVLSSPDPLPSSGEQAVQPDRPFRR